VEINQLEVSSRISKQKFTESDLELLLQSTSYRDFIKTVISIRSKNGKPYGYATIARNSGFASRGFPHDVTKGAKRLTIESMHKMAKGLGLTSELHTYFIKLVEFEHPDCRIKPSNTEAINRSLTSLRQRLLQKKTVQEGAADSSFQNKNIPILYASLGTPELGASLNDVVLKTGLSITAIESGLATLIQIGLVQKINDRYYPRDNHVSFQHLTENNMFKDFYLELLSTAEKKAHKNFTDANSLFFSSAFSVQRKDLPLLKEELREVLLKFVDQCEQPNGDQVVSLVVGLLG
jgi:uncharacterized protein (TIGR02147 family)